MCTGIKIDYDQGCVIGRTMDFEVPLKYNTLYLPRGYDFGVDLMGKSMYTKYKTLGICFENKDYLKDGINEYGLSGITNEFSGFNLYSKKINDKKYNISSLSYFTYALSNYKSIDELINDLENINISLKDKNEERILSPDFHFMFVDSRKKSIVIEPKNGELIYKENPYDVMTNSPKLETHIKRLKEKLDIENPENFNSAKNLPGGYDPVSRFIKAFYLTKMNIKSKDYREALSNIYNILGAMAMPDGFVRNKKFNERTYTRYICAYDTFNKYLTVKSHLNPTVYQIGFEDIEAYNERQAFYIENELKMEKLK